MAGAGAGTSAIPNVNQAAAQGIAGAGMTTAGELGYTPGQIGTIAGSNIAQYQNPYTQQVIQANEADILRGAQIGLNELGAQAQAARAFGGSRHGVAMGEMGRNVLQQLAQSSAGLRQTGFQQAQSAAQQDIQNRLAQEGLGLQGSQQRLGAASQLGNIANLGFGMGQTVTQNMMQQGALQQALQQQLIDAAKGQYAGYTGAPAQTIGYVSSALGATPVPQNQTTSKQPGLFDYLTMGASLASMSDERLKADIKVVGMLKNGIQLFTWKWNETAKKLGAEGQRTFGVMAQKLLETHPDAVFVGDDGYYRVNYGHPALSGV